VILILSGKMVELVKNGNVMIASGLEAFLCYGLLQVVGVSYKAISSEPSID